MKYKELAPITRKEAEVELASDDWENISRVLLRLSLNDPDPVGLEALLMPYLQHQHPWVRGIAAMCLGHVARIHGTLNTKKVIPAIRKLLKDKEQETRAKAKDALEDIEMFVSHNREK